MRAYYGSRISEHIAKTPEGYLVCRDVPIARTGIQNYRGEEFGGKDPGKIYRVERPEEEVFSTAALASFEGKPVVDEHPDENIGSDNALQYLKGTCRNVHRGTGPLSDCIVADLIIYDKDLIRKIEEGKRDVSCGYDCLWVPDGEDGYTQREIRGNHVAVVDRGRAGHKVSIRDSDEGGKRMTKKTDRSSIFWKMFHAFAKDADPTPEEMAEAAKLNPDAQDSGDDVPPSPAPEPDKKPAFDAESACNDLNGRLKRIEDALNSLAEQQDGEGEEGSDEPAQDDDGEEPNDLDNLEGQLRGSDEPAQDDDGEDVPPAAINQAHGEPAEDDDNGGVIEPDDSECEDPQAARDAALDIISGLKPIIASLPKAQRKKAADSMAALLRGNIQDSQYGVLARAQRNGHAAHDAEPILDDVEYGRMIRDKYNPHYNHKKED